MESEPKDPEVRVVDRRWWARGESTGDADDGLRKPSVVEDLERRLADTAEQLKNFSAEHRRSLEEFEQVRTRLKRESEREVERGRRAVLVELLEVVDNLDRAIAARPVVNAGAPAPETLEQLSKGVEMVRDQFLGKLGALGVLRVPAMGEPFDAAKHEAVSTAPVDEDERDGVIVAVVKEGYAIGDELLRPATVVVGRRSQPTEHEEQP
jgi:molecular chaperone GrpE